MDQAATQSNAPISPISAPSSVDNQIADIGNAFLKDIDENPDPNRNNLAMRQEEAPQDESPPEDGAEPSETTDAESGQETPQTEEELEEAEYEGKQYRVPKELKNALLRQADYTRKTQEIAERGKQLDRMTQASQVLFQQAMQFAPLFGQAQALEQHIQALQSQLTPELESTDLAGYLKSQNQLTQALYRRQELMGFMQRAGSQFQTQQAAMKQQAIESAAPILQKEIPDFGKPETQRAVASYAKDALGFSEADLQAANWSPGIFRALYKAMQFDKGAATAVQKAKEVRAKVQNLPPVKPTGRQPSQSREGREKEIAQTWKKGGGKLTDPALDALLRNRLGG